MFSSTEVLWLYLSLLIAYASAGSETGPPDSRVIVMEDDDVILPCSLSTNQNIEKALFVWEKEGTVPLKEVFMYRNRNHYNNGLPGQDVEFKGRVSHFPEQLKYGNASIRMRKTKLEDRGIYTCSFPMMQPSVKTSRIELVVGSEIKVVVLEGSDAILPCSLNTKESVEQQLFDWMKKAPNRQEVFMYNGGIHYNNGLPGQDEHFRGRVSHFPQELQFGNASIIIRNTTVADSGDYTCDFPHLQTQSFNIRLVVEPVMRDRVCEILGAAPKPLIHVLKITEDEARLKCEVRGAFPKPKVEWRDGDGNILPAEEPQVSHTGERYNITLLTTVTRTNISPFLCVATQEEISHETEHELYVTFCGTYGEVITGLAGWFSGMLSFALVLAVLVTTKTISIHSNRGCLGSANKSSEDPPAPDSETGPEELKGLNKVVCSPAVSHCSLANYRNTFCGCQLVRKSKC